MYETHHRAICVLGAAMPPQLTGQGGSLIQPCVWLVSRGAEPPLHDLFVGRFGGVSCIALLFVVCMGARNFFVSPKKHGGGGPPVASVPGDRL